MDYNILKQDDSEIPPWSQCTIVQSQKELILLHMDQQQCQAPVWCDGPWKQAFCLHLQKTRPERSKRRVICYIGNEDVPHVLQSMIVIPKTIKCTNFWITITISSQSFPFRTEQVIIPYYWPQQHKWSIYSFSLICFLRTKHRHQY